MLPEGGPEHQVELPSEVLLQTVAHPALSRTHASRQPSIAGVGLIRMIARAIITRQQTNGDKSEVEREVKKERQFEWTASSQSTVSFEET